MQIIQSIRELPEVLIPIQMTKKGESSMEKRNFVTSVRTSESSDVREDIIGSAVCLFAKTAGTRPIDSSFEKKACEEDEKSDSQG